MQCLAITALIIIKSLYAFIEKKKIINNHFILRLTSPRQLILSTILSLMVLDFIKFITEFQVKHGF